MNESADAIREDSSDEEMRDRLMPIWQKDSIMNRTSAQFIKKRGLYLWAFGENENRALSVQQKVPQIDMPMVSKIPLKP